MSARVNLPCASKQKQQKKQENKLLQIAYLLNGTLYMTIAKFLLGKQNKHAFLPPLTEMIAAFYTVIPARFVF
jgi:hypothetical protein